MNRRQAHALRDEMAGEDYHGEIRLLGNGRDFVVIINSTFLWSRSDWRDYKKGKLASMESIKQDVRDDSVQVGKPAKKREKVEAQ